MAAYPEIYLDDAMRTLAEMTEYCFDFREGNLDDLFKKFVISGYAKRWESGDPQIICGLSGAELYDRIMEKCGFPYEESDNEDAEIAVYDTGCAYWCGYMLSFYQWNRDIPFRLVLDAVTQADLFRMYPAYHTASEELFVEALDSIIIRKQRATRLQTYRKALHISQAELAELSGVNLRTLQEYEIGRKELAKASAGTAVSLAKALYVSPETLI